MLKDIKELSWDQSIFVISGFLGSIAPGFLLLYLFKPELILSLDSFKLVIFSLALSLPVVFLNILMCKSAPGNEISNLKIGYLALVLASFSMYPSILMSYLFQFSFFDYLKVLLVSQCIVLAGFMIDSRKFSDKETLGE